MLKDPINIQKTIPDILMTLAGIYPKIAELGLDAGLVHLVRLRASQINGCAYCVKMHTREAREGGETNERLDQLVVWKHVDLFTDADKAAFAWTEALTCLSNSKHIPELRAELRQHYSDKQIAALTSEIAMINLWNRVQISDET